MKSNSVDLGTRKAVSLSPASVKQPAAPGAWLIAFAVFQFVCQISLLVPPLSGVRVLVRAAAFGASLALLFLPTGTRRSSSVQRWAFAVLGILLLEFFHPDGTLVGSIAQFLLYAAILGPIFWVRRLRVTPRVLDQLFLVLWLFYTMSAAVGVLQAYFPGSFQPALSSVIADLGRDSVKSFQFKLASGERVFRPMGLTDVPGGASYGAVYAVLLSLGILQAKQPFFGARILAIAGIVVGLVCLYLCQVRAAMVMLAICVLVLVILLALSGRVSRLLVASSVVGVAVPLALGLALSIGGRAVTDRLGTLMNSDPSSIYYKNRGLFLEYTIDKLLPLFPFGAGLGRWGMTNLYFGSRTNSLWVEIQWTGWLFDGGVPMIIAYSGLIAASSWRCLRIAFGRLGNASQALSVWPSLIVAYNVGAVALCFSYSQFIGTSGLEFWVLNAAVLAAAEYVDSPPT